MANILLVDDELNIRLTLSEFLQERMGHTVTMAQDGNVAKAALQGSLFDVVISDLMMPHCTGEELLEWMKESGFEQIPFICISGRGGFREVIGMMQKGALDFIAKPFQELGEIEIVVNKAIQFSAVNRKLINLEEGERSDKRKDVVVGNSPSFMKVIQMVSKVAPTVATVLITGESGTGKEVIARAIHETSPRRNSPFVAVNCAAIPATLIESELFGHERGAFTGAVASKPGKFRQAHLGTLFLDEIGELDVLLQSKLLRAIQELVIEPVGSTKPIPVDVRIIAATNRDLSEMVKKGTFREDLLYRLQVFPIHLPPLRERKDDLLSLTQHIVVKLATKMNIKMPALSESAFQKIYDYRWPGNIRELENSLERALIVCRRGVILPEDIWLKPPSVEMASGDTSSDDSSDVEFEVQNESFNQPSPQLPVEKPFTSSAVANGSFLPSPVSANSTAESNSDDGIVIRLPSTGTPWETIEHQVLVQTLKLAGGNVTKASEMLALPRSHLRSRLRFHNLGR